MIPINRFVCNHCQAHLWPGLAFLLLGIMLAACVPVAPEVALTATPSASTGVAAETMPETTVPRTPTATPTLTAGEGQPVPDLITPTATLLPPQILLGQPVKVGRGQIVDAAFLPDGDSQAIAVGWAGGVSLVSLDGTERWWQPTAALLIALDASPQGDRIAAVLEDGSVVVFAADSGAAQAIPASRPYVYWSDIAFAPDGEQLAFQSIGPNRGDPIYLLDLTSYEVQEIPRSRIDPGLQPSLVWSPDGQALALPGLGEVCPRTLDVNTGERLLTLRAESGCYAAWAAAFAPDGQQLAVAAPTGGVELVQPDDGSVLGHLSGDVLIRPDRTVPALRFSPDGRWLFTPGGTGFYGEAYPTIVWDVAGGVVQAELPPAVGQQRLTLAFAGEELLSLYNDGRITRWPFTTDAAETAVGQIPVIVPYLDLHWSGDSRRLIAPLTFGGAAVWQAAGGELLARFDAPYTDPRLSPDGRLLALRHPDNRELSLHDLDSGAVILTVPNVDTLPDGDPFSPDGQWLAYGVGNVLNLLDISTGETGVTLNGYPQDQIITRVIWSPDGEALIAASAALDDSPGLVVLWEKTGDGSFVLAHQAISIRSGYTCCVTIAAFSPSGRRVAFELLPDFEAGSLVIEVYDRQERELIFRVEEYELNGWITDDLLMTNESQYYTRLTRWNVVNSQNTVSTAPSPGGGEQYAPNGQYYADTSSSGANIGRAIKVVNWESSQIVAQVNIGNDVNTLRWSPDGRWLAALVSDSSLWLLPVTFPAP